MESLKSIESTQTTARKMNKTHKRIIGDWVESAILKIISGCYNSSIISCRNADVHCAEELDETMTFPQKVDNIIVQYFEMYVDELPTIITLMGGHSVNSCHVMNIDAYALELWIHCSGNYLHPSDRSKDKNWTYVLAGLPCHRCAEYISHNVGAEIALMFIELYGVDIRREIAAADIHLYKPLIDIIVSYCASRIC